MKNLSRKETCWAILQQVPTYLIAVLSLLICGFLTVASLFSLAVMRMDEIPVLGELPEQLVLAGRNVLHVAPVVAVLSILLLLLARQNFTWKHAKIVTWAAAAVQTILGFWWKSSFASSPVADQGTFWNVAESLAGHQAPSAELLDYLRYWPFQAAVGMTGEPFARLFNGNYGAWQVMNAFCVGGCVMLLSCICGRITNSPRAKACCAVLVVGFFPLNMYTTFVYGTLSGTMTSLLAVYAVIRQCTAEDKKSERKWWAVGTVAITLAITLYTGMQIFLVAVTLLLLATGIFHKDQRQKILGAVLMFVVAFGFQHGWQALAMHRMGLGNEPGCPIWPRIAMGVDANTDVTPGFYNCVNAGLYYASNFVPKAANERAMDYIVLCLNQLWETGRFGSFFYEKTADQWLEPWFGGLTMNNPSIFEEPKWLATAITSKTLFVPVHAWLSMLISVVYVWSTVGVVVLLRKHKTQVWQLSLAVCLIGGFVFQLAAEAKVRYCLPYFLCCFPLAAAGLAAAAQKLPCQKRAENTAK